MSALEYASGAKSECVGKPEAMFFRAALEDIGCEAKETVVIGDVSMEAWSG